jgi:hypothetical protein
VCHWQWHLEFLRCRLVPGAGKRQRWIAGLKFLDPDQAIFMRLRPVHKSAFQCAAIYALTAAEVLR